MASREEIKKDILKLVRAYWQADSPPPFVPGESAIPYAGRVYDDDELVTLTDAALEFWLTSGRYTTLFERDFASFVGNRYALLVNSGSSANLLAMSALTSPRLGEWRMLPGDEVITVAAGFPTTVNPILQNGFIPVFCDVELGSYNIRVADLAAALSPKTKAIFIAHTLGNPFDLDAVMAFAKQHNLFVIEDCCDALGAEYDGKKVGTFGDIATFSFYPAHHITMGEGGAVSTSNPILKVVLESFRDWGRDCYCAPGKENTCGKRFGWQLGNLPFGYDHKYIYSHVGYNLKATDLQAAIGVAQLKKAPHFIAKRRENFAYLYERIKRHEQYFILPVANALARPSWFGFLLTVRPDAPFTKGEIVAFLEGKKIATRMLFSGNITKQPYFADRVYKTVGPLTNADMVMTNTFWVGVYPGLTEVQRAYMADAFDAFISAIPDVIK